MTDSIVDKDAADMVCVLLEVHIWSGRRHMDKTDLVHANSAFANLPEKDLASLGSVKICDPEDIKVFNKIKNQAETVLKRAGLPILGSTGVPSHKYADVYLKLQDLQLEFETKAALFVAGFDTKLTEWKLKHLLQHPEWSELFKDLPTAAHVFGRFSFAFHSYRISAPAEESATELNEHFGKQMGGLKGELLREVATEAGIFVDSLSTKSAGGVCTTREFVTPKTLGPLRRAAEKLDAFSFIDQTIGPLATMLMDMLNGLPDLGRIDGAKLMILATVAKLLNDPEGISTLSTMAFNGQSASDTIPQSLEPKNSSTHIPVKEFDTPVLALPISVPIEIVQDDDGFLSNLI